VASLATLPALLAERKGTPSVVVTFGYNAHVLGAAFGRSTGTPHVINWHRQQGWPMSTTERGAVRVAARAGAAAIAVTSAQIPDLERLGLPPDRVQVVPNGVPATPNRSVSKEIVRAQLGLPRGVFLAVLVARLRPEKRVGDFVDAMAQLGARVPQALGVVVGDGELAQELRHHAKQTGAPVRFAGFEQDPAPWMLAADVVCLTSDFEALPMALAEATACGRPCIATDVGGNRELVEHGLNGYLVPARDPQSLVQRLESLARDPELRSRMGEQSFLRWEARFSFDAMVDRYFELLSRPLAGAGFGGPTWLVGRARRPAQARSVRGNEIPTRATRPMLARRPR
jgi:glycosyltransferase involved in cell wall biosynthesis